MLEAINLTKRYNGVTALDASTLTRRARRGLLPARRQRRRQDDHHQPVPELRRADGRHGAHQRPRRDRAAARDEEVPRLHPRDGDALPEPDRAREPRVLQRAGRAARLHARAAARVLRTASGCRPTRPIGASAPTRRGCARRSASRSRWPRTRRRCCSTSRRPASIRKPPNEFSALLAQTQQRRRRRADGDPRSVPREGVGHARRHHEARARWCARSRRREVGHADLERIYLEHMHD